MNLGPIALLLLFFSFTGCASHAYTNVRLKDPGGTHETKAAFSVKEDRGSHLKTLGILALSGGGSRAAYFSASVMLALEDVYASEGLNILEEVDVISAVSGGALPGAYYAVSSSPGDHLPAPSGRLWEDKTVKDLMSRRYRSMWVRSWFLPTNIARYWFTAFDRSDIMAQVFADNLFDNRTSGVDLRFRDLNPERPYIVLNASNGTVGGFSERFTFTREDFTASLNSDIDEYEISRAVMASASYPGAFHYMTLKDFTFGDVGGPRYLHVLDGGITDNLGLDAIERLLVVNGGKYERVFIILVDAHTGVHGVSPVDYDPRRFFDYAVNRNLLDSVGSLLEDKRRAALVEFMKKLEGYREENVVVYHMELDDVGEGDLLERLFKIRTDFNIRKEDAAAIEKAVGLLIVRENGCIERIREILMEEGPRGSARDTGGVYCKWGLP